MVVDNKVVDSVYVKPCAHHNSALELQSASCYHTRWFGGDVPRLATGARCRKWRQRWHQLPVQIVRVGLPRGSCVDPNCVSLRTRCWLLVRLIRLTKSELVPPTVPTPSSKNTLLCSDAYAMEAFNITLRKIGGTELSVTTVVLPPFSQMVAKRYSCPRLLGPPNRSYQPVFGCDDGFQWLYGFHGFHGCSHYDSDPDVIFTQKLLTRTHKFPDDR